jgi:hypothetical protein
MIATVFMSTCHIVDVTAMQGVYMSTCCGIWLGTSGSYRWNAGVRRLE